MELHVAAEKLFGFTLHRHVFRHLKDHFIPHKGNKHLPHVLHHRVLGLYGTLLVIMKLAVIASPIFLPYSTTSALALTPDNVVVLTNQSRTDYHLAELSTSPKLAVAAANKARDMMDKAYFAHFSPTGVSPWYWITQSGYEYVNAGENLAIRFTSAEGVQEAWLNSPTHRANILSPDFSEIGVAVLTDTFGSEGTATIVIQMFGSLANTHTAQAVTPTPQPAPKTDNRQAVVAAQPTPQAAEPTSVVQGVVIDFPIMNSSVKTGQFEVLGRSAELQKVRVSVDNTEPQEVLSNLEGKFSLRIDPGQPLAEGKHEISAQAVGGKINGSDTVKFVVDETPPVIERDSFSIRPALEPGVFALQARVGSDSIRTIVTAGEDSAVLDHQPHGTWSGQLHLYHAVTVERLLIEVYAQDLAGNEARVRVGELVPGEVKGLFSFVSGDASATKTSYSFLGGLIKIGDLDSSVKIFYLLFAATLGFALILKIAINRHVQHMRAIAGGAGVMILAMILFVI